MDDIPGDLYQRLQAALLRCGPFDSDRALRPLFVDARLSVWRDLLPEAGNRVERARAVIDALSQRANPAGENALALLLRVLSEQTPPGDACHLQLAALAQEVAAVLRVDAPTGGASQAQPLDIPALRARLQRLDAVDIESLCLDHFPEVYDKFTRGLQRGEMINLLLDHCRRRPVDAARLAKL